MSVPSPQVDVLLTTKQAARLLLSSTVTLERWRGLGAGPAFVRLGRRGIRYRATDIQAWIRANLVIRTMGGAQ